MFCVKSITYLLPDIFVFNVHKRLVIVSGTTYQWRILIGISAYSCLPKTIEGVKWGKLEMMYLLRNGYSISK